MNLEEYLRDLAERLRRIPVMHGVDDHDCSTLRAVAGHIEQARKDEPAVDSNMEELLRMEDI